MEGRVIEATDIRLDFDPLTRTYTLIDPDEARLAEVESWLRKVPPDGDGLTYRALTDRWGIGRGKAYSRVEHLLDKGRMRQREGKSGNQKAMLHWSIPAAGSKWRGHPEEDES